MMPFMCLAFNVCAYGMDNILFWTHLVHGVIVQFTAVYYTEWSRVVDAMKVRSVACSRLVDALPMSWLHTSAISTPQRSEASRLARFIDCVLQFRHPRTVYLACRRT